MKVACQFIKNVYAFYRFLSHYIEFQRRLPDLNAVPAIIPRAKKGGKTVTFRFLNKINIFNVEMFVLHLKYYGNVR